MHIAQAIFASIFFLFGLLAGCSTAPPIDSTVLSSLEGCWYGEDFQPAFGARSSWLMNRKSDGTFSIEFRTIGADHQIEIQSESGRWDYIDGIYTTITTAIDGNVIEPPYTDDYKLKSISDSIMIYHHVEMDITFTSMRVSCDIETPNPAVEGDRREASLLGTHYSFVAPAHHRIAHWVL